MNTKYHINNNIIGYNYSVKADIWSIGVVYFEMLFGFCPFEDSTI
jgi:serine/threonine-protein kinase ULK/ATG1